MHWTLDLVSFASLKHELMIILVEIPFISRKSIMSYTSKRMVAKEEDSVYKRYYDKKSTNLFKQKLCEPTRDNMKNIKEPNEVYKKFLEIFSYIYEN